MKFFEIKQQRHLTIVSFQIMFDERLLPNIDRFGWQW